MRFLYKAFGPEADNTDAMPVGEWVRWKVVKEASRLQAVAHLNASAPWCNCNWEANNDCSYHQNCRSPYYCQAYDPWWGCGDADWCDAMCSYDPAD
jgi:hypothetical protein